MRTSLIATMFSACCLVGCSSGPATCFSDDDCPSGGCYDDECREVCEVDSECPGDLVCGWASLTRRGCVPQCTPSTVDVPLLCIDGVPTSCTGEGADASCSECGCLDASAPICDAETDRCRGPNAVGEACRTNAQCVSENCAADGDELCSVARGEACDAESCGLCVQRSSGTECAQACVVGLGDCEDGELSLIHI